jgi:fidgetin-like protein 1
LQCKERVDLLEALKKSREDVKEKGKDQPLSEGPPSENTAAYTSLIKERETFPSQGPASWLGSGTIPPVDYVDLSRPPPLPTRPRPVLRTGSSQSSLHPEKSKEEKYVEQVRSSSPQMRKPSRTPSPEKQPRLLKTLRGNGKDTKSTRLPQTLRSRPPEAAKAATQAWGFSPLAAPAKLQLPLIEGDKKSTPRTGKRAISSSSSGRLKAKPSEQLIMVDESQQSEAMDPVGHLDERENCDDERCLPRPKDQNGKQSSKYEPDVSLQYTPSLEPESHEQSQDYIDNRCSESVLPSKCDFPHATSQPIRSKPRHKNSDKETNLPTSKSTGTKKSVQPTQQTRHRISEGERISPNPSTSQGHTSDARDVSTPASKSEIEESSKEESSWDERVKHILGQLPKGVDGEAARQILNDIVIQGDEVHWSDIAGLNVAKSALKETVVYPFLRPDLFMGLREPARGMLLFGPPGTGKTMLARAVATESKSTFFAISASSLTSKYLGESEKLVKALFSLAKYLAPSIIFVDEIDSLLSSRTGPGEHEATRRIKTEFLIQWSDLAKAAAGRESNDKGKDKEDASRVLVLAATNLPWCIDEAARRRFVRRQYIPLPEPHVRKLQLQTLLSQQKQDLSTDDLNLLVEWTDGNV